MTTKKENGPRILLMTSATLGLKRRMKMPMASGTMTVNKLDAMRLNGMTTPVSLSSRV